MDTIAEVGRDKDLLEPKPPAAGDAPGDTGHHTNGHNGQHGSGPAGLWTPADSAKLYRISSWGQGYFSVNDAGHVAVHPTAEPNRAIDLKKLVDELRERDIQLP